MLYGCQPSSYDIWYKVEVTETIPEAGATENVTRTDNPKLRVDWRIYSFELTGEFVNTTDKEAIILWDNALYLHDSESEPLIFMMGGHDLPQSPTAIPAGGKLEISMTPLSNANWRSYTDGSGGGFWYSKTPLFGITLNHSMSKAERQALAQSAVGKQFTIKLPVRLDGSVFIHEYRFRVVGADVNAAYY